MCVFVRLAKRSILLRNQSQRSDIYSYLASSPRIYILQVDIFCKWYILSIVVSKILPPNTIERKSAS